MKRIVCLFLLVVCYGHSNGQNSNTKLSNKFFGQWINTSLFDSTAIKRKLSPWIIEFYGTIILNIKSSDSVSLFGNVDGGAMEKIQVMDNFSFSTTGISFEPKFNYVEGHDVIKMTTKNHFLDITFRRVKPTDRIDIIKDEEKFENYFKTFFFYKYLKADNNLKIDKLWIGFRTYAPFQFDAIGIKNEKGEIEYFGWELNDKTLRLYQTKRNTDEDSGFYYWTKGKLEREIKLR